MVNRQLNTFKFNSAKLKACRYRIDTTLEEAREQGEVIALSDCQMFRTIRDIRKRTLDRNKVERLFQEKEELRRRLEKAQDDRARALADRLAAVRRRIDRTMFVPDYITVVIDSKSHYKYMYKNGFWVNGKRYVRISCSAGQARNSTVVFCCDEISEEVKKRIGNDRDLTRPLAPSKFNAYFGLSTSSTFVVSEPRIAVVGDYDDISTFMCNFDTETDWAIDDEITIQEVRKKNTRNDGQGLISPGMAARWAEELGLDWVPCSWIVRWSFLKGMVCVFDYEAFCREKNGGNYLIPTVYKDSEGNPVMADVREVDVIVTASQFKLWDSWPSLDKYLECCHRNRLYWGIASYAPKVAKDVLTMNY